MPHATPAPDLLSAAPDSATQQCGAWILHEFEVVDSTNLVARSLPLWHAVRANTQTRGRGRFQRHWVSDLGGLWLSAVVPCPSDTICRRALPLCAGLAVCELLRILRVAGARLRWPNDVMVGRRKLAGLLIDEFVPGRAVVGIGMNVSNRPERVDPALDQQRSRLADLLDPVPSLPSLTEQLLALLREAPDYFGTGRVEAVFARANEHWRSLQPVELDLDGRLVRGLFRGLDAEGRLHLLDSSDKLMVFDPHQIRHLTEL